MSNGAPKFNEAQAEALRAAIGARREPDLTPAPSAPSEPPITPISPTVAQGEHFLEVLERLPDVNHKQRRIAFLISTGKLTHEQIAAKVGCTLAYVRVLAMDGRIKKLVELFKGGLIQEVAEDLGSEDVLEMAAVRAAEVLADKMNHALDESNQIKAAIEILKLTNHYDSGKEAQVKIVINRDTVELYEAARQEIEDAEYTVE
jgi:hypothetical protein